MAFPLYGVALATADLANTDKVPVLDVSESGDSGVKDLLVSGLITAIIRLMDATQIAALLTRLGGTVTALSVIDNAFADGKTLKITAASVDYFIPLLTSNP